MRREEPAEIYHYDRQNETVPSQSPRGNADYQDVGVDHEDLDAKAANSADCDNSAILANCHH